jgi:hypothetical protein
MKAIAVGFDDWFNPIKVEEVKEPSFIDCDIDPLIYVVEWIERGLPLTEIHSRLQQQLFEVPDFNESVVLQANNIRNFFKNTILLRRLKNEYISPFMGALEELNENVNRVNVDYIKILVKLPDFYRESTETRDLFANHTSLDSSKNTVEVNEPWTFVKKIKRSSKQENFWRYYFSNSKKELMSINCKEFSDTEPFLNYVSSLGPVGFKGFGFVTKQPGHDFLFYKLSNYELYPIYTTVN